MIIYKTTNLMNSKVYVGKACGIRALPSSLYLGSGVWIKRAIAKYGKENFKRTTIDICENKADQNRKEIFWIAFYRELYGKDAIYNLSDGGDGCCMCGKNHHMYGKHHSEETKRRMSLSGKGLVRPEETKLNISRALSGRVLSAEHRQKLRDSGSRYWALKRNAAANVQSA